MLIRTPRAHKLAVTLLVLVAGLSLLFMATTDLPPSAPPTSPLRWYEVVIIGLCVIYSGIGAVDMVWSGITAMKKWWRPRQH